MRTAEELLRKQEIHQVAHTNGVVYEMVKLYHAINSLNEARIEAIQECAKEVRMRPLTDEGYDSYIDTDSILKLIDQVK